MTGAPFVYLDYNATAPMPPAVRSAISEALALPGNPNAMHSAGRAARRMLEEAREEIASALDAKPSELVLTSGGTEANALAIRGRADQVQRIAVSAVEHASVLSAAGLCGLPVLELPVDGEGVIRLDSLELLLSDRVETLVCVMAANNETGVIQPLADVIRHAKGAGALVHVDAVQAFGRIPIAFASLGADSLSVSAHKLGGPKGTGALAVRAQTPLRPLLTGGGQERGRRAGTENVAGAVGFAAAVRAARGIDLRRIESLRETLERDAMARVPEARIFGTGAMRLGNTSALALPGVSAEVQVMALDLDGICVSAGAACSSGKVTRSHVLAAMGAGPLAGQTIRVSLGPETTAGEIERFLGVWERLAARRGTSGAALARQDERVTA